MGDDGSGNIFASILGLGAGLASQSMQDNAQIDALKLQTGVQSQQIVTAPTATSASVGPLLVIGAVVLLVVIVFKGE